MKIKTESCVIYYYDILRPETVAREKVNLSANSSSCLPRYLSRNDVPDVLSYIILRLL